MHSNKFSSSAQFPFCPTCPTIALPENSKVGQSMLLKIMEKLTIALPALPCPLACVGAHARNGDVGQVGQVGQCVCNHVVIMTYLVFILPYLPYLKLIGKVMNECVECSSKCFTYNFDLLCCRVRFLLSLPNAKNGQSWRMGWVKRWESQYGQEAAQSSMAQARQALGL
jgi:hypothetical protein